MFSKRTNISNPADAPTANPTAGQTQLDLAISVGLDIINHMKTGKRATVVDGQDVSLIRLRASDRTREIAKGLNVELPIPFTKK